MALVTVSAVDFLAPGAAVAFQERLMAGGAARRRLQTNRAQVALPGERRVRQESLGMGQRHATAQAVRRSSLAVMADDQTAVCALSAIE